MPEADAQNYRERRLRIFFLLIAVALGALETVRARHAMNPDGISYLDLGDAYLRGDWSMAVNGLWSPLYAWLIGLAVWLLKPSPYYETPLVHLVNFCLYLAALACFDFFLHELIRYIERRRGTSAPPAATELDAAMPLPRWAWTALGYPLFIWTSLYLIGIAAVTPDMCLAACVYWASALLLRIRAGGTGRRLFAGLGAALGVGYLAKAAMFPLAFVFLLVAGLCIGDRRRAASRVSLAFAVFLLVGSVYYAPLSLAKGRLTFGESGRLNYLWYINKTTLHVHWQGEPRGSGTPAHPTRKLFDAPALYEFRMPLRATYPPWFDPSYWYEGARARIDFKEQWRVLKTNTAILYDILFTRAQVVWIIGFLILWGAGCVRAACARSVAAEWRLLLPATAALLMYASVRVEARYVGAFVVLLALGLFSGVRLPRERTWNRLTGSVVCVVALVMLASFIGPTVRGVRAVSREMMSGDEARAPLHLQVVESLRRMGVGEGAEVASIGYGFNASWARLARVRIVAEITSGSLESPTTDVEMFWRADAAKRARIVEIFATTGARAIVAGRVPRDAPTEGWQRVGETDYYIYSLAD